MKKLFPYAEAAENIVENVRLDGLAGDLSDPVHRRADADGGEFELLLAETRRRFGQQLERFGEKPGRAGVDGDFGDGRTRRQRISKMSRRISRPSRPAASAKTIW